MNYQDQLFQLLQENPRLMVMTAENRAAIRQLPPKIGNRFIDTGITEQTMVGMAAGLAMRGRVPVAHALATFLTMRAFEFIRTDVGIPALPVKLMGAVPGFLSEANGPTHQALEDIALMRGIPNIQVFCPADNRDLEIMLPAILESANPAYVRFNDRPALIEHQASFEIGRAEVLQNGRDVAILTYGFLAATAVEASRILEAQGVSVTVVNLRSLQPVDATLLLQLINSGSLLVTLEDHFRTGGLYSILCELMVDNQNTADVLSISMQDRWFRPALLADVMEYEKFTAAHIAAQISQKLAQG